MHPALRELWTSLYLVILATAKACLQLIIYKYIAKDAVVTYSVVTYRLLVIECYSFVFLLTWLGPYSL